MISLSANEKLDSSSGVKNRYWEYSLVGLVFCIEAFLLQWLGGCLANEYSSFSDEPSHYVTSLMVHDFILSGEYSDPIRYAEDYYTHYPKVAIGHWPPIFYALLGVWFIFFGISRISALSFIAIVAATTATAIYHLAKSQFSKLAGAFAASIFLALPFVQQLTGTVMLGHLVTLFTLLSVIFLTKFLSSEKLFHGLLFSIFATLAILTRGSAWAIGLMPILTMLFAWRFNMLLRPVFWLSAVPVIIFCVPWYLIMPSVNTGAFVGEAVFSTEYTQQAIPHFAEELYKAVGLVLFIPILFGIWVKILVPLLTKKQVDLIWPALAALVTATYLMHVFVAASLDSRYMLVAIPALILFAVAGIEWIANKFSTMSSRKYVYQIAYIFAAIAFLFTQFSIAGSTNTGYTNALSEISKQLQAEQLAILVASESVGEGSVIAAAASQHKVGEYVLRGSKLFVDQDWFGRVSEEKVQTTTEIAELLDAIPVNAVILDTSINADRHRNYYTLLKTMLFEDNDKWLFIGEFPLVKHDIEIKDALLVFVSKDNKETHKSKKVNGELIRTLYGRK